MLIQPTLTCMRALKLHAMADAFEQQCSNVSLQDSSFEDRVAMLIDAERQARDNRRLGRLVKTARLKIPSAAPEDIDFRASRGLDKAQISSLLSCDWINRAQVVFITGPTGAGKTWLACALANQALRLANPVFYRRMSRVLEEMEIARSDGSLPKLRLQMLRARLVVIDDWGLAPLTARGRQDLLDIIEDRSGTGSIIITSQMPVAQWHDYIGDPTIADAIIDRIIHSAHRIALKGESMRKQKS